MSTVRFVTFESIHSINGRSNSLLPWLWDAAAGADPAAFQSDMQRTVTVLSGMLKGRGVEYSSLKSALVPNGKKRQIAFLYDWYQHPPENYAIAFSRHWLPALRKDIRTSVLTGDLLGGQRPDYAFDQNVHRADKAPIRWDTQFAVYFSSLSDADVEVLHAAMEGTPRYRGYLDVTFAGEDRNYLSRTLTFPQVIVGKKIVTAHDNDDFTVGSQEPTGYPFAEHGYDVITVHSSLVLALLHYKIEADDSPDNLDDLKYSLGAITGASVDLDELEIAVDPKKVGEYLLKDVAKLNLMKSLGLESITADELGAVITDRLRKNYVYDLRLGADGVTPTFAVSGEFTKPDGSKSRRLIALRYDAGTHGIALVSMY